MIEQTDKLLKIAKIRNIRRKYIAKILEQREDTRNLPALIKRVYISGPISIGDPGANIRQAMKVSKKLTSKGFYPLCPHLKIFSQMFYPEDYETLLESDFAWIEVSDAILRIPGVSVGADAEIEVAGELGIPRFFDEESLFAQAERIQELHVKE